MTPPPASKAARDVGCKCPVIDNHYGHGWNGQPGVYCYSGDCEVHEAEFKAASDAVDRKENV